MVEMVRSILGNSTINGLFFVLWLSYTIIAMIYTSHFWYKMTEKSKVIGLLLVPFILSFFACGYVIQKGLLALFCSQFILTFMSWMIICTFGAQYCDKE